MSHRNFIINPWEVSLPLGYFSLSIIFSIRLKSVLSKLMIAVANANRLSRVSAVALAAFFIFRFLLLMFFAPFCCLCEHYNSL
nr:MAG TPA: Thioredoxin [Caudoviricetes sp.]